MYINEHYNEQIRLLDIANAINISPNYLSEVFLKETGLHISDYLTQVRILYAIGFLENAEMNITDIASAVGFNSFSSFSRAFKKVCGITPSKYITVNRKRTHGNKTVLFVNHKIHKIIRKKSDLPWQVGFLSDSGNIK